MTTTVATTIQGPYTVKTFLQTRTRQEDGTYRWLPEEPPAELAAMEPGLEHTNYAHTEARVVTQEVPSDPA